MIRSKISILLCLACVSVPSMAQNTAAIYRPTVLQSEDPNYYYPNLLNNRGDYTIVGMSDGGFPFKDSLSYAGGGAARMGSIRALNDLGQAVGSDFDDSPDRRYFGAYMTGSTVTELPGYEPAAINNRGTYWLQTEAVVRSCSTPQPAS